MAEILLFRHGKTRWNEEKRVQGWTDVEENSLLEQSIEDTQRLAGILTAYSISAIYTSPLKRAQQTARILNERAQTKIIVDENLMEMNFGLLEGNTKDFNTVIYANENNQALSDPYTPFPHGESYFEVYTRCVRFSLHNQEILQSDKSLVIVGHSRTNSMLRATFLRQDIEVNMKMDPQGHDQVILINTKTNEERLLELKSSKTKP